MAKQEQKERLSPRQLWLHEIIFESDTLPGKIFDLAVVLTIFASVAVVMLDSIAPVREKHGSILNFLDLAFTIIFSIEYLLRLYCVARPGAYAVSFFGIIDLLAVLPGFIQLFVPGSRYLSVVRIIRVLRVFRILKLAHYIKESQLLASALMASRRRILVFVTAVFSLVVLIGSIMYVIEGEDNGFTSIPVSIYWAIVTLTTVGYGDISPKTSLGQAFSALIMILGYGIIAIPTGIITSEIISADQEISNQACPFCMAEGHNPEAVYCFQCGKKLNP